MRSLIIKKIIKPYIGAALLMLTPAKLLAGDSGHGGGGYICTSNNGQMQVRLVDLEEANLRRYVDARYSEIPRSNEPIVRQITTAVQRLAQADFDFALKVEEELVFIQSHFKDVPSDWAINRPEDVNSDLVPLDCPLEGVATYWDEWRVIWIQKKYYENMISETDKAALFMHEAVYRVLRGAPWKDINSKRTRKIIGILFSIQNDFTRDLDLLKKLLNP